MNTNTSSGCRRLTFCKSLASCKKTPHHGYYNFHKFASKKECGGMKYVVVLLGNERTDMVVIQGRTTAEIESFKVDLFWIITISVKCLIKYLNKEIGQEVME